MEDIIEEISRLEANIASLEATEDDEEYKYLEGYIETLRNEVVGMKAALSLLK
jgi:hypothetical protein